MEGGVACVRACVCACVRAYARARVLTIRWTDFPSFKFALKLEVTIMIVTVSDWMRLVSITHSHYGLSGVSAALVQLPPSTVTIDLTVVCFWGL